MSPVAEHKTLIPSKRLNCKTVERHHISIHAETAAYHAYRSTIAASAALSTGYFSSEWQLITIFKQRKIKENPMQNLLHLQVPCDTSQSKEKDSTYCSAPFSCLSGRRKKVKYNFDCWNSNPKYLHMAMAEGSVAILQYCIKFISTFKQLE